MKGIFPMTISLTCHGSGTKWRRRRGSKEKNKGNKTHCNPFSPKFLRIPSIFLSTFV